MSMQPINLKTVKVHIKYAIDNLADINAYPSALKDLSERFPQAVAAKCPPQDFFNWLDKTADSIQALKSKNQAKADEIDKAFTQFKTEVAPTITQFIKNQTQLKAEDFAIAEKTAQHYGIDPKVLDNLMPEEIRIERHIQKLSEGFARTAERLKNEAQSQNEQKEHKENEEIPLQLSAADMAAIKDIHYAWVAQMKSLGIDAESDDFLKQVVDGELEPKVAIAGLNFNQILMRRQLEETSIPSQQIQMGILMCSVVQLEQLEILAEQPDLSQSDKDLLYISYQTLGTQIQTMTRNNMELQSTKEFALFSDDLEKLGQNSSFKSILNEVEQSGRYQYLKQPKAGTGELQNAMYDYGLRVFNESFKQAIATGNSEEIKEKLDYLNASLSNYKLNLPSQHNTLREIQQSIQQAISKELVSTADAKQILDKITALPKPQAQAQPAKVAGKVVAKPVTPVQAPEKKRDTGPEAEARRQQAQAHQTQHTAVQPKSSKVQPK